MDTKRNPGQGRTGAKKNDAETGPFLSGSPTEHNSTDGLADLHEALAAHGLTPSEVVPDGIIHRFPTNDTGKDKAGFLAVFDHGEGVYGAFFGDWRTGARGTWFSPSMAKMDPGRQAELRARMEQARKQAEQDRQAEAEKAAHRAREIWEAAAPARTDHPYLVAKQVPSFGLRESERGQLIVPVLDPAGKITSLQFIDPDGGKKFLTGGKVGGGCFSIKGDRDPLFIVEGFATGASVHLATGCTVVCAFNAGNLKPVALAVRQRYPEAKIVVAGDDDQWTPGNPGKAKASAAAQAVGGSVVLPEFKDLTDRPTDFNDLHRLEDIEAVKRTLEGQQKGPAEPVRFWDRESKGEPFPVEALPKTIRAAVLEYQAFGQQPAALVACSALAAVNLVTQGLADVGRDRLLYGPSGLFFMPLADSGERKSAADSHFSRQIREWDRRRREVEQEARKQAEADHEAWKAERAGIMEALKAAARKGDAEKADQLKRQAAQIAEREPVIPPVSETFFEDTNPAALADRLANQGCKRASLWSSEALAVTGGSGMSSENFRATFGLLNKLWTDEGVSYVRKVAASARVEGVRFNANLMMQQAVFRDLLGDRGGLARGSGLLARFLLCAPASTMGTRFFCEAPETTPAGDHFHRRIADLLELPMTLDEEGRLAPPVLFLAPEAKALWIEYHNEVEKRLAPLAELADVADFGAKSAENVARLACTFHVFEHGPEGEVTAHTMNQACEVGAWFLTEARRILGLEDVPQEERDAARYLRFLVEKGDGTFSARDILKSGPRPRGKKRRDPALSVLRDHGWITWSGDTVTLHPLAKGATNELP